MSPRDYKKNQEMRDVSQEKITKAALEVFARYGYFASTMNQIQKYSGVSKGLVYHYFPSKEKIFLHLVDIALTISAKAWRDAEKFHGTAWMKIRRLTENLIKVAFTDESSLYFLIMLQAYFQINNIQGLSEFIIQRAGHFEIIDRLVIQAQKEGDVKSGDPEILVSSYNALFQGYSILLLQEKKLLSKISPDIFLDVLRNPSI